MSSTHVFLPIKDLQGCEGAILCPIELTKLSQAMLESTMDERIFSQLLRYYVLIPPGTVKRVKPAYLKRFPTR